MRKLLVFGGAALLLFAISAGISWYLHGLKQNAETEAAHETSPTTRPQPGARDTTTQAPPMRPSARPTYNPEADTAVQLAAKLREQEESLRRRELQFSIRQKQLEIIYGDIRNERGGLDLLRKQVDEEAKALNAKAAELDRKALEMQQQRLQTAKETGELKRTMTEFESVESDRIKQMAAIYDTMAPENAAKILQNLIDANSSDIAVKIMASMKERQAARVLAEFRDPTTAAQLLEKLKGLKRPTVVPASGTKKQP